MNTNHGSHDFTHGAKVWNTDYALPKPLDNEQLRRFAPSIFAEAPHASRSDRYRFVPTIAVVEALRSEGFVPVRAQENWVRDRSKVGYALHTLRFRTVSTSLAKDFFVGDSICEITLTNSHDGSSGYAIEAGLFRFACSNALLVSDSVIGRISVKHFGRVIDEALEGTFRLVHEVPKVVNAVERFRAIELTPAERTGFARGALELRWPTEKEPGQPERVVAPIRPEKLLEARRFDDQGTDLWKTMNVVQEHLTKGGDRSWTPGMRRRTTRAIKSINEDQRLNRALWAFTEEVAKQKKAA
jgi:hypothetical protein